MATAIRFLLHLGYNNKKDRQKPVFMLLWVRPHARPYWNGGIWYKRTHGREYR